MVLGSSTRLASDWSRAVAYDIAHPQSADTLAVACLAAASTPWLLSHTHHGPAVWLCDVGLLVPLVWRRRQPVVVFALLAVVAFVQWLTAEALVTDVALLAALFTVAFERPLRTAIAAGTVLEAGVILASFRWSLAGSWIRSLVALSGLAAVALLLGAILRVRRAHLAELTERAARLELERDQQAQIAAAAERTRIAREMHDVIAHSLAVMVTMADGATAKLARDPARAGTAIQAISDVGRQALGETRRLLGVLRAEDKGPDLAPQPGLAQLEELMEQLRATGLKADLVKQGRPFDLPPGAELTVYRLVQEAGTNTLKHAPTATSFRVRLDFSHPRLLLEAVDDGPRVLARNSGGAGHGIAGMRERVSLYGGTVDTGPSPDGGWVVRASLDATSGP
jgi:signal transduction histidine kinase